MKIRHERSKTAKRKKEKEREWWQSPLDTLPLKCTSLPSFCSVCVHVYNKHTHTSTLFSLSENIQSSGSNEIVSECGRHWTHRLPAALAVQARINLQKRARKKMGAKRAQGSLLTFSLSQKEALSIFITHTQQSLSVCYARFLFHWNTRSGNILEQWVRISETGSMREKERAQSLLFAWNQ